MEILTIEQVKSLYPDEWVLLSVEGYESGARPQKGKVLLHGKDYLEICYKGSEMDKKTMTTIFFTGSINQNRKWLKSTRLQEKPKTT